MCGIAGWVGHQGDSTADAVRRMMDALARRGPDSEGLQEWPGATLGHRRLAILDLSPAGHQPMLSDDGQTGLVFNGCIYNFQELRAELKGLGERFRSHSDTEVLLRGYLVWGIDNLAKRLRGMFAFGIWDHPRRTLTLVRDRLGVKPLVYCEQNGELAFASTVAALRKGGFGGGIDDEALLEFLEFGYVSEARSVFQGIHKLPPATILEWSGGQSRRRQYWKPPLIDETSSCTFEEAVEETERLLIESVRLRLVADVPIATLLSGGIDSALICWALRELNADIRAFTVKAMNDPADESAAAARTAALFDIPHQIVDMPASEFSLEDLMSAYSEPFGCQSAHAMLWASSVVKNSATVLLTGDGGDDVFMGYPDFRTAWRAQTLARHLPYPAGAMWRAVHKVVPRAGILKRARNFLDYATGGIGDHLRAHNGLPYYETRGMIGERLEGQPLPLRQVPARLAAGRHLLQDVLDHHRKALFTGEFMVKVDGATTHYGLEARAPFLDQKIWEFASRLPPEIHLHGGRLKAVLREIARRHLGPEVAYRPKRGFTVPGERWYAERWRGMLTRLSEGTLLEEEGWIRRGSLVGPIQTALEAGFVPPQLINLLVLEYWLRTNHTSAPPRPAVEPLPLTGAARRQPNKGAHPKPMKVCLLIDSLGPDSGNELLVARIANGLDPAVVEAHVCCFEPSPRLFGLNSSVRTTVFPRTKLFSPRGFWQLRRFRRYLRTNRIDAIHSFVNNAAIFSALASIGNGRRAVITARLNCGYDHTKWLLRVFRVVNHYATHIVANSVAAKKAAVLMENVSPDKITVIYQGVDLNEFAPSSGDPTTASLPGIPPHAPLVGIVANCRSVKNLALFVRAAAKVLSAVPEAVFVLVGQGPLKAELQKLAVDLGIAERLVFSSPEIPVSAYLARMSVACLSSQSESFPNAILEYMACGLPVVATAVGGVPELVRDGETGYLVRTQTPEAFAQPIVRLLRNPKLRAEMGRRGLELARKEFDDSEAIKRLEQFYLEAVASGNVSRRSTFSD